MVVTHYQPVLTRSGYGIPTGSPELQEALDGADAALPPEVRERHPIVSRDEINTRYPDTWIALLPTHVDERDRLIAGRLVAHSTDWQTFKALIEPIRRDRPDWHLFVDFTGKYPLGKDIVHV